MGYVDENLTAGEVARHRTRLHAVVMFWPMLIGALLGVLALIGLIRAFILHTDSTALGGYELILLLIAAAIVAVGHVRRSATEMAVTNRRLIVKTGVLSRRTTELILQKIESIAVEQGILGRLAGYGDIVVRGTGGTFERFKNVERPLEFRRFVQEQIERHSAEGSAGVASPQPGTSATRFCSRCGAPLGADARFCARCGAAVSA